MMYTLLSAKAMRGLAKGVIGGDGVNPLQHGHGHDSTDPPGDDIWCGDLVVNGKGAGRQVSLVLENARTGFVVTARPPAPPPYATEVDFERYRERLDATILSAIKDGLTAFGFPKQRVWDYINAYPNVIIIKAVDSMPSQRVHELCRWFEEEGDWKEPGVNFTDVYNIKNNFSHRKYGFSTEYAPVADAMAAVLRLTQDEWNDVVRWHYPSVQMYLGTENKKERFYD